MSDPDKTPLRIIRDSREQDGFGFETFPCTVEIGTLDSADYSLHGFTDRIGIERKTLDDLVQSISTERDRFRRELLRLRAFDSCTLVVEEPLVALRQHRYRSRMDPESAEQSLIAYCQRFRLPIYFAAGREDAERFAFNFLRHFARDRLREFQALGAARTGANNIGLGAGKDNYAGRAISAV